MAAPQLAATSGPFQRFAAWQISRYGNLAVAPAAALLVVIGAGFVISPDQYTGAFYTFLFAVVPAQPTGLIFAAVGTAALLRPNRAAITALVGAQIGWAFAILYASLFVDGVSPTGWATALTVAVTLFLSVASRTPPARRKRR